MEWLAGENEKVGDKVKKRQKWEWQLYLGLAERLCRCVSPRTLLQSDCAACSFSLRKRAVISYAHTANYCAPPAAAAPVIISSVKAAEGRQDCSNGTVPQP